MPEPIHAYLTDLGDARAKARAWEASWGDFMEFVDQFTVAYDEWIELLNAVGEAVEEGTVPLKVKRAYAYLVNYQRPTADNEV